MKFCLKSVFLSLSILALTIFSGLLVGCGQVSSSTTTPPSQITTVSFSISPNKAKYNAGEDFVITMTKTGPLTVSPNIDSESLSSGSFSSFPRVVGMTIQGKASSTSGGRISLTCGPDHTQSINGVQQIVVSGNANFVIETQ